VSTNTGLNIFKASAGSGKTFRLVGEYLKLLFAQPMSYRNILAVTFTNKATAEMKERILKELANLSNGGDSKYLEFLKEFGNEQRIRARAPHILKLILHDYSRFSVMTIDSFFQKVIRSFAREIRLNASFRTEIDNRQALEDAVDLLFQEIDSNDLLMDWMVKFLEENLEEGKTWDFKKELLKFGQEVDKESFKLHGDEFLETLEGKAELGLYVGEMKKVLEASEKRLMKLGKDGLDMINGAGLTYDQFKNGKSSFATLFNKLVHGNFDFPGVRVTEAVNNPDHWFKKTDTASLREKIAALYQNGLNSILSDSVDALQEEIPKINSAKAILKNIYPFGLLGNIALKMKEVLRENNTVLLSDSGRMIGKIIEGNDTPFIYEKVGLIYRHFMLDEFQDTSRQQWTNFRPLVENALASGYSSLVVGDVKQSIYRFRNGDWNLLANQLEADLRHQTTKIEKLDTNRRSKKNIVDFNNTLFGSAAFFLNKWFEDEIAGMQLPGMSGVIENAYADQRQHCSQTGNPDGLVKVSFVVPDGTAKKSEFMEKATTLLIEQLETVQQSGVKAEEITILVRVKSEAEFVAKALWEKKRTNALPGCCYDAITSDTLRIGQSPVVRFVVNFFRVFARRDSQLMRAEILYSYFRILLPVMPQENKEQIGLHELFDSEAPLPEMFEKWLEPDSSPEFFTGLLALPQYDLAVAIADHFHLGSITGEKVYLQAFLDMVLEYGGKDSGGIQGFLDWWETSGCNKTLNLPNLKNFIRISTIHQSKGLEYNSVFLPFCNWEVAINTHFPPYLWTMPESEPFNKMKMVLLKCESDLKNSVFSHDYYREKLYSIMDNLNLLYVAMTRAVNNLFIIMPYKEEIKNPVTVAELIQTLIEFPQFPDSIDREENLSFGEYWDPVRKILQVGSFSIPATGEILPVTVHPNTPLVLNRNKRVEIRLHSKDYFLLTGNRQAERINKGTVIHQIFEKIVTVKDVGPAVNQMVTTGLLNPAEGKEIFTKIDTLLQQAPFSDWFGGQWKVLNERDILRSGETRHRPDRVLLKGSSAVVIDYKTGERSDKDIRQMKGYLTDLMKMGYTSGEGNIWYLQNNEVVKVEVM